MSKHITWSDAERLARTIATRRFNDKASTHFDRDDLIQHALLAVWREFPADEQGVVVPSTAVLCAALANRIVDALRKLNGDARSVAERENVVLDVAADVLADVPRHDIALDVHSARTALATLDERTAFTIVAQAHGYTSAEIARHLGIDASRVRQLQKAARAKLCDV